MYAIAWCFPSCDLSHFNNTEPEPTLASDKSLEVSMFDQLSKDPAAYNKTTNPFGAAYVFEKHTDGRSHLPERDRAARRNVNSRVSAHVLAWFGLAILHVLPRAS
jgi:hypothetical protein